MAKRAKSRSVKSKTASLRSFIRNAKAESELSPRDERPLQKSGSIVRFTLDPSNPPKVDRRDLGHRTEAQIIAAAKSDPDNPPLTKEQLKGFKRAVPPPDAKAIRKSTGLSQAAFAWRYGFDVSALRDWEQGRRTPDRCARVLLAVIKYEPKAVERALAEWAFSRFGKRK